MATDEWSVLYARMRTDVYEKVKAAAAADDRAIAKWVELHFREFFESAEKPCAGISSSPDTDCAPLESDS